MKRLIVISLSLIIFLSLGFLSFNLISVYLHQLNQEIPIIIQKPTQTSLNADKLWSLVQEWRQSQGLKPYIKDQRLCKMSNTRLEDVYGTSGDTFNHNLFETRYSSLPYKVSENLSIDYSELATLKGWLDSSPHAQALHLWTYSCISCKGLYCVQIFSNF